jgi:hypothetical protein
MDFFPWNYSTTNPTPLDFNFFFLYNVSSRIPFSFKLKHHNLTSNLGCV